LIERRNISGWSQACSALRLREHPPPGVIIDELPLEDIPLLLSRGAVRTHGANKTSESDTAILRSARRKILARLRGVRARLDEAGGTRFQPPRRVLEVWRDVALEIVKGE